MGEEGLRSVAQPCLGCEHHVECLKHALNSPKGILLREEKILNSMEPELIKRLRLWSMKKEAAKEQSSNTKPLLGLSNLKALLFQPWAFFASDARPMGTDAFSFGLLWGGIGSMIAYFWQILLAGRGLVELGLLKEVNTLTDHFTAFGLLIPLMLVMDILLGSIGWHFMLTLVGGNKGGFRATFSGVSASEAAMVLGVIPLIGPIISEPWKIWIQLVAMKHLHGTSYIRIILSFVLLVLSIIGLVVLIGTLLAFLVFRSKWT